jgi:hypothetical protein
MPLGTAQAPARGRSDLQLDGNVTGEIMGPGIFAGNIRVRHGVSKRVALVGDVGMARADGESNGLDPRAGTARAGVHLHGDANEDVHAAVYAGAGGGYAPTAGGWASVDAGAVFTGNHRHVRPIFLVQVYGSQPIATRVFTVGDTMLRLPRTFGVQGLLGFDLGPRDRSLLLGLAIAQLSSSANDQQFARTETFFGLGAGFRFGTL